MDLERILNDEGYLVEPKAGFVLGFGAGVALSMADRYSGGAYLALVERLPEIGGGVAQLHRILRDYAWPAGWPVSYAVAGAAAGVAVLVLRRVVSRCG